MAKKKKKQRPLKARDYTAMSACLRVGGPMKDRRTPRGGARNRHKDYLDGKEGDIR